MALCTLCLKLCKYLAVCGGTSIGLAGSIWALFLALAYEDYRRYTTPLPHIPPATPQEGQAAAPAVHAGFLEFPEAFVFGAATAAYQIEGGVAEGGRGPSIWDDLTHNPRLAGWGLHNGDVACDHFHRWKDDVALMGRLGLKAYRFSISWSRLLPNGEGEVNPEGVRFYSELIDELLRRGIEPWVTIYHWDLPSALNDRYGGWLASKERIVGAFGSYARTCFKLFGDRVKHWITLNEPWVASMFYMPLSRADVPFLPQFSTWPSRRQGRWQDPYTAAHHMLLSHAEAVRIYRTEFKAQGGRIGITLNTDFPTANNKSDPRENEAAQRARDFQLGWFADPVYFGDYPARMRAAVGDRLPAFSAAERELLRGSSDFFGINNYFTHFTLPAPESRVASWMFNLYQRTGFFKGGFDADRGIVEVQDPQWARADQGWPMVPWGFRDLLLYIQERYAPPGGIAITENGCAAEPPDTAGSWEPRPYSRDSPPAEDWANETFDDPRRVRYLKAHLSAVHAARAAGADVRAYFAWSLLDNFEWIAGYRVRFGIVRVDYATQKRTVKASGRFYSDVISRRGLDAPPQAEQLPGRFW